MPKRLVRTLAKSHSVLNALYKIKQCEKDKELMCVCVCQTDRQTEKAHTNNKFVNTKERNMQDLKQSDIGIKGGWEVTKKKSL